MRLGISSKKPVSNAVLKTLKAFESHFLEVVRQGMPEISEPSQKAIEAGGKRLRPALVIIAAGLGEYVNWDQLMRACSAVELVHLASLVHDDVLDGSYTRRGVSTINANYGQRRAVIIGDYLFGLAFDLLSQGKDNSLMEPLATASIELSSGELRQRQTLRQLDQSVEDYLDKIYAKTAALFVASCLMGARLARLAPEIEDILNRYAGSLGMAFQIYDDILDFTGDEDTLGKPVGSDVREGTVTLPMIHALALDGKGVMRRALENPQPETVTEAVSLVRSSGAVDEAKKTARRFVEEAKEAANLLPNGSAKRDMVSLGNFVIDRYH
jgi:heptaprenyl diphosphate synthase